MNVQLLRPRHTRPVNKITQPFDIGLELPGSKSLALRQLFMSALAKGPSQLRGLPECEDLNAMRSALEKFGVQFKQQGEALMVIPPKRFSPEPVSVDLNMSGVTLRFMLAFAALRQAPTRFDGHPSLRARPNAELLDALQQLGCQITSNEGKLPIEVIGPQRPLRTINLDASVSSQFLSALLLIGPRLSKGLCIKLTGKLTSAPYVELTRYEMARRNVAVDVSKADCFRVNCELYAHGDYQIEGDATAATYFAALAVLHGSRVRFTNLGGFTQQGDYAFFEVCRKLGATVKATANSTSITGPRQALQPLGAVDFSAMPDAAPTLMAMAPLLPVATRLTGLETLPFKECDRITCMANELRKLGVYISHGTDWATIYPAKNFRVDVEFETYHDHRMAMSLAVLISRIGDCRIIDPACVNKTYTHFWRDLGRLYPGDSETELAVNDKMEILSTAGSL